MRRKHLESALSSVSHTTFPHPKIKLEQYPTSPQLASSVILCVVEKGDLIDDDDDQNDSGIMSSVLDVGCGTGILGIACGLAGAANHVILLDCDDDALELARENVKQIEDDYREEYDTSEGCVMYEIMKAQVQFSPSLKTSSSNQPCNNRKKHGGGSKNGRKNIPPLKNKLAEPSSPVRAINADGIPLSSKCVDVVITNPPFGTKHNAGVDMAFLFAAVRLSRKAVYSFHKSSTRKYILKKNKETFGTSVGVEIVAEMKFEIGNMYKFHKEKSKYVHVDLVRVRHIKSEEDNCNDDDLAGTSSMDRKIQE
eukprot:CAMPEP_0194367392 /NCGR_PEP_ID=MMETSP0174-20130528/15459_1 /TAXON_ID=216777 /ORGANISM="Proboscia alata, Strain PI-D3" /LENGTH=309 /DNA_ID=CAMNT_0039143087 /DNA_START=1099 /DNA_END=2028 /DNA_ORIENTATION=-